jgi:lipid II:glycine glycyltransferase (peptidoglycan interpeptide bridge formation enzyme)
MVVLASHRGRPIAGAVYFHFGEKVLYKYGASDKTYQELRANNLVMWEAITWYAQNGFHSLCFGRTDPDHDGLRQFKTGWGTRERVIKYYRYDLKKEAFVKNTYSMNGRMNKIFHRMPISCLNLVGALVYRHMG